MSDLVLVGEKKLGTLESWRVLVCVEFSEILEVLTKFIGQLSR